ncbi:hypothetical protein F2981_21470 (plasmid) [Sinorhizobium meliloti]|nr:hypothetical protein [Sinorhizobium meliloti]
MGHHERILCASRGYLAEHGVPQSPADINNHNCLLLLGLRIFRREAFQWRAHRGGSRPRNITSTTAPLRGGGGKKASVSWEQGDWLVSRELTGWKPFRVLPVGRSISTAESTWCGHRKRTRGTCGRVLRLDR